MTPTFIKAAIVQGRRFVGRSWRWGQRAAVGQERGRGGVGDPRLRRRRHGKARPRSPRPAASRRHRSAL